MRFTRRCPHSSPRSTDGSLPRASRPWRWEPSRSSCTWS
jgi:hypothetical protein